MLHIFFTCLLLLLDLPAIMALTKRDFICLLSRAFFTGGRFRNTPKKRLSA